MNCRHTSRLRLEQLEGRLALAGNVIAALSGADLSIMGDAADNSLAVTQNAAGDVFVHGLNGTTVNGAASATFPGLALIKAEFKMEAGDDSVAISGLRVSNDLSVETGDGDDLVEASNVDAGDNFSIKVGRGGDLVGVANTGVGGDMNVEFDGEATLFLTRMDIGKNLLVATKDGNDRISIDGGIAVGEDLAVSTGKGDDIVTVADLVTGFPVSIGRSLNIDTDEGHDRVTLHNVVTGEDVSVNAGKGNDTVRLTDVSSGKSLSVNTDDGNDSVTANSVIAAIDAFFVGGAGTDTLDDNGITAGSILEIKEFEIFV